jgi:hypothetical protein
MNTFGTDDAQRSATSRDDRGRWGEFDAAGAPAVLAAGSRSARAALIASAMAGYALLAAFARPLTLPSAAAILLPGAALLWYGVRRPPTTALRVGWPTVLTWITLGLVFCAWELVAFYSGNDPAHPTFSLLTDPIFATYPGRVAGYSLWLVTGAWLVTR